MDQLATNDGRQLAYCRSLGLAPEIVYLCGYTSDMESTKARSVEAHAHYLGHAFTRFDYSGHGRSSGCFEDQTISSWLADTLTILDEVVRQPFVLVGTSMGGWLMLLAGLARKERLRGLVGIAPAPDFTAKVMEPGLTDAQRTELRETGRTVLPSDYGETIPLRTGFIEDGNRHCLLGGPIAIDQPVHILHGQQDLDVPWEISVDLAAALASPHVTLELVKDGDHRLSRDQDLRRISHAIDRVLDAII